MSKLSTLASIALALTCSTVSATQIDIKTATETMDKQSLNRFVTFFKHVETTKDSSTVWKTKHDTYQLAVYGQMEIGGLECKNYELVIKSGAFATGHVCSTGTNWLFDVE